MRTQLSISENYCKDWGVWEGVREVIQNWMDSRDEGNNGEVKFYPNTGTLIARNDGVIVDVAQLALLGETSKGDGTARGMFGEGIKIGMLAFVRQGYTIFIRSGPKTWRASIEPSREFGRRVLTLTSRRSPHVDYVEVKIVGITEETWAIMQPRFIDLRDDTDGVVELPSGRVLRREADRGQIYVKGIYVGAHDGLRYGYDFKRARVDRDRRLVSEFDVKWYASEMIAELHSRGDVKTEEVLDMLESGSTDTCGIESHVSAESFTEIERLYTARHGETAVPVLTDTETQELAHHGLNGRRATQALATLFQHFQKGAAERAQGEKAKAKKTYKWDELNDVEQLVVLEVFNLLRASAVPFDQDKITFVDFVDARMLGQFEGGEIRISRRIIGDRTNLLETLIEEIAHHKGGDSSQGFKEEMHKLYGQIVASLARWTTVD